MEILTRAPFFADYLLPAVDVLLLAFLLYQGYRILARTRAIHILKGASLMAIVYAVAFFLNLRTVLWVLNLLVPGLVIGIAIIFQPELRQIFIRLGRGRWLSGQNTRQRASHLQQVLAALDSLRAARRGALIVLIRNVGLQRVIETGTAIGAEVSASLLASIFAVGAPLHDGAVIIDGIRVVAAGCFLPSSEQGDGRQRLGTRHRAAQGVSEESDAVALVLSEETGSLALAFDGELDRDLEMSDLRARLEQLFEVELAPVHETGGPRPRRLRRQRERSRRSGAGRGGAG